MPAYLNRTRPQRRGEDLDPGYVKFLNTYGECAACEVMRERTGEMSEPVQGCEGAHTQNNGMRQRGPDSSWAPLCHAHHLEYDAGREIFEIRYVLEMHIVAEAWYRRYIRWKENRW